MPEVTFAFDSASAYTGMLARQRRNFQKLRDEIGHLGLNANELLAHMYRYAGVADEEAVKRGTVVKKPVDEIRTALDTIHAQLGILRDQLRSACQAMDEADARRSSDARRLKI